MLAVWLVAGCCLLPTSDTHLAIPSRRGCQGARGGATPCMNMLSHSYRVANRTQTAIRSLQCR